MAGIKTSVRVNTRKLENGVKAQLTNLAGGIGRQAAIELEAEVKAALIGGGGGGIGLSTAGFSQPVREGFSHIATGATYASVKRTRTSSAGSYGWKVTVGGAGKQLNYGQEPGFWVPRGDLEEWVAAKSELTFDTPGDRSRFITIVQRHIYERGTAPTYFFTDAARTIRERLKRGRYNKSGGK